MTKPVIEIKNLKKGYRLGYTGARSFRDELHVLWNKFKNGKISSEQKNNSPLFWALNDVSLNIEQGEILGIVGRNGAGKSTLLKLLSNITEPTSGKAIIRGRVASLLEVGTGFHPELSGRDNVYLSGSLLGMKKAEIKNKFEDIVAFAEVEKFIDTPVKRYSSGMSVRLGFAIAAHLDPDILIIDEVLAVGDTKFQEKCLNKMKEIRESGKTILFVSHNPLAIRLLCTRCVVLSKGELIDDGNPSDILFRYQNADISQSGSATPTYHTDDSPIKLNQISIKQDDKITSTPFIHKPIEIVMDYEISSEVSTIHPNIHLHTDDGNTVFSSVTWKGCISSESHFCDENHRIGKYQAICVIPPNYLNAGSFDVSSLFMNENQLVFTKYDNILAFNTQENMSMRQSGFTGDWIGITRPLLKWEIKGCNGSKE